MYPQNYLKKLTIAIIVAIAISMSYHVFSYADTIVVPDDYLTIQAAINDPLAGLVLVKQGTYTEDILMRSGVRVIGGINGETKIIGQVTMADSSEIKLVVIENAGGAGIIIAAADVIVKNTVINVINKGIDLNGASAVTIENNTIHSQNGPCVNSQNSDYVLRNNILTLEDTAQNAINAGSDTPEVLYNCILGKISPAALSHKGTIFVSPSYVDTAVGDFHLAMAFGDDKKSISVAMDSGDPASDYSLELQDPNNAIDMGAYGNTREAPITVDVIHVPEDYPTIAQAVAASYSGVTISLAPGTYGESVILPEGVSLIGSGKEITTVNGKVEVGSDARVVGITFAYEILDNSPHYLLKVFASNVTIKDCDFRFSFNGGFRASYYNRLAYLAGGNITVEGNRFYYNSTETRFFIYGIYCWITPNLVFRENEVYIKDTSDGLVYSLLPLYLAYPKDVIIEDNVISADGINYYACYGLVLATAGTVYDNALVKNNTINLKSTSVYPRHYIGVYSSRLAHIEMRNNIINFETDIPSYYLYYVKAFYVNGSGITGATDISLTYNIYNGTNTLLYKYPSTLGVTEYHNIKYDPGFINSAGGDFHLSSTSIAIDKGKPADDYSREPQPNGGRINCGAYGNTPEAAITPATGLPIIIYATAETGGSITPRGALVLTEGQDQTFTIQPYYLYEITDVLVDGVSEPVIDNTYTFTGVTGDHTIIARFNMKPYKVITATVVSGVGYIRPSSGEVKVEVADNMTFTMQSGYGYYVEDVLVDDVSVGPVNSYTFENVTENHTLDVSFILGGLVTAIAGEGGTITPSGRIEVELAKPLSFTITPDYYHQIDKVLVDGYSVGQPDYYRFDSVYGAHTIEAVFKPTTYYLSIGTWGEGTVNKSPDLSAYPYGTSVTLDAIPDSGYYFSHWEGDTSYISNIYSSHVTLYMYNNIYLKAMFYSSD